MKPSLLVIDLQRWFFQISAFAGWEGQEKIRRLIAGVNELITFFKKSGLPIIHILTVHKADGSTRDLWAQRNNSWVLIEGTKDVEELEDVLTFDTDIVIHKTRSSSYLNTNLAETLKKLETNTVVIAGYSTNKCIGMACIESCERDFDVLVSDDAILGPNPERVAAMLHIMKNGYGIIPVSNAQIIAQIEA